MTNTTTTETTTETLRGRLFARIYNPTKPMVERDEHGGIVDVYEGGFDLVPLFGPVYDPAQAGRPALPDLDAIVWAELVAPLLSA